jgi:undecaprenyl diphosphate synthase
MFLFGKNKGKNKIELDTDNIPEHIAIIMDGNGRWAKKRGLPRSIGHREGANNLKKIVRACDEIGVKYLTVYAFSTENWTRPKDEVDFLMSLLLEFLKNADKEIAGENIRIKVIGEEKGLSSDIKNEIRSLTERTKSNDGLILTIALNYGGRCEIVEMTRKIAGDVKKGKISVDSIDEKMVSSYLYTSGMPDPDLIIRPSGEFRLSNFLLWQSSYSEIWCPDILWPDFSRQDLNVAIAEYQKRNRRFGGR